MTFPIFVRAPFWVIAVVLCGTEACRLAAAQAPPAPTADSKKISGLSVVLMVESARPEPVFQADGYRIRIAPTSEVVFHNDLKTLRDVGPNTWIRFEGRRDDGGTLVATKAEFFPAGTRNWQARMGPKKAKQEPDYQPVTRDSLMDADGNLVSLHTKVRYSESDGYCAWHRVPADQAIQERVERVGMKLVPAYQRELAPDDPSRIAFRFYAVDYDKIRSAGACNAGLVLIPKNVVERLKSDDQLAAVLADAVSMHLRAQLVKFLPYELALLAGETTPVAELWLAANVADVVVAEKDRVKLEHEVGRISLQLMADAGYDPWQAPEAWRLLEKRRPENGAPLKYTSEGNYQLGILRLQYRSAWKTGDADLDGGEK